MFLANMVLPFFFTSLPILLLLSPIVIVLEMTILRKYLGLNRKQAFNAALFANTFSFFVGIAFIGKEEFRY